MKLIAKINYVYEARYKDSSELNSILVITQTSHFGESFVGDTLWPPDKHTQSKSEWAIDINSAVWSFAELGHKDNFPEYFL